jgi:hypothetical protein
VLKALDPDGESGRGLLIVDSLASAWGVDTVPGGKRVWFRIEPGLRTEATG